MTVDLTPEDLELLHDALDEQLRKARAVWSIYGIDRRDHITEVKALRAKLCASTPAARPSHGVHYATVRATDEDDLHIECRFRDGQKYAAIKVDEAQPELANAIARFLSIGKHAP